MRMIKPKILLSKCLELKACRYNGQVIPSDFVRQLQDFVEFIAVCPEEDIGLGTPRDPVRLVMKNKTDYDLVQPASERTLTQSMNNYADKLFDTNAQIDGAILKSRSPSCGIGGVKIYAKNSDKGASNKGKGIFAKKVFEHMPDVPVEDEGRLNNFNIRELFLIRIFTIATFRSELHKKNIGSLQKLHAQYKYMFMCFDQNLARELGGLLGSHDQTNLDEIIDAYHIKLLELLKKEYTKKTLRNVFTHIYGHFKDELTHKEYEFFENTVEDYMNDKIPLASVFTLLDSWSVRFNNNYIAEQKIFQPYPKELMSMLDSGKGRI